MGQANDVVNDVDVLADRPTGLEIDLVLRRASVAISVLRGRCKTQVTAQVQTSERAPIAEEAQTARDREISKGDVLRIQTCCSIALTRTTMISSVAKSLWN